MVVLATAASCERKEVDFALEAIEGIARAIQCMASIFPEDQEGNCQKDDQKEFHMQLVGIIGVKRKMGRARL